MFMFYKNWTLLILLIKTNTKKTVEFSSENMNTLKNWEGKSSMNTTTVTTTKKTKISWVKLDIRIYAELDFPFMHKLIIFFLFIVESLTMLNWLRFDRLLFFFLRCLFLSPSFYSVQHSLNGVKIKLIRKNTYFNSVFYGFIYSKIPLITL